MVNIDHYLQQFDQKLNLKKEFPLLVDEEVYKNIHPVKQKYIKALIEELKSMYVGAKFIVFGSAITYHCNSFSDIDIIILGEFQEFNPNIKLFKYGEVDLFGYNIHEFFKEMSTNKFFEKVYKEGIWIE